MLLLWPIATRVPEVRLGAGYFVALAESSCDGFLLLFEPPPVWDIIIKFI